MSGHHPTKPPELWRWVARCLRQRASPDQIAGRLCQVCSAVSVSVPAIYAFVRRDERSGGPSTPACAMPISAICGAQAPAADCHVNAPRSRNARGLSGAAPALPLGGRYHARRQRPPAGVLTTEERTSRYTRLALLADGTADRTSVALQRMLVAHQVRSITFIRCGVCRLQHGCRFRRQTLLFPA